MIRILLVDDHPSVMEGTKMMLEKEPGFQVTLGSPGDELLHLIETESFDLMLFDLNMPGVNGIELAKKVLELVPGALILIYTGFDISPHFSRLIEMGVAGFVPKTSTQSELVRAIRHAINNEAVIPLPLLRQLHKDTKDGSVQRPPQITDKEIVILKEVAKGKSNKVIAEGMYISQRSLEYALTQLFQKLSVHSRNEAVVKSKQMGLLLEEDFY